MKKTVFLLSYILLIGNASFSQTAPIYTLADKIHVEGDGGWDLLAMDESSGRLFLSHGMVVQVLDVKTKKVVGTIPDTKGVHGIALANDLNKGFTSNGKDTSVTIFNLKTLSIITKVKVKGVNPDVILYDIFSHRVFVYNGKTSNATVIDGNSNKVIGTIDLPGKPELSVSDGQGQLFVNIEDKSTVCQINATTLKVEQTWPIAPGQEASGLALDIKNHRLFIVCDNKMMVIMNSGNGKVITSLPIGEGVDGVVFDPGNKRAYSSNGEGTVTVIQEENENSFKILENVITQKGARTIAIDTKTHHIYLPAAEYEPVATGTEEKAHTRPKIKPNTFVVLDIEPLK